MICSILPFPPSYSIAASMIENRLFLYYAIYFPVPVIPPGQLTLVKKTDLITISFLKKHLTKC